MYPRQNKDTNKNKNSKSTTMGLEALAHQNNARKVSSRYNYNTNCNGYIHRFIWLLMVLTSLTFAGTNIFLSDRIIPEIVDYDLVPAVVAKQPVSTSTLTQQTNNNHTVPVNVPASTSTSILLERADMISDFPVLPSEWVEDISSLISCGGYKCVFSSNASEQIDSNGNSNSSASSGQTRYGYTISQQSHRNQSFNDLVKATDLAQQLSDTFHIRHLLAGQPRKFNITEEQIYRKGLHKMVKHTDQSRRVRFVPTDSSDLDNTQLIVQPIQLAPTNALVFGCALKKKRFAKKALENYLANANANANATGMQASRLKFAERMLTDLDASRKMVNSTMGSCMKYDFQILIDPKAGSLYHFDIDRCFAKNFPEGDKGWGWDKCFKSVHRYLNSLIDSRAKP
jgi:hypothetical protein